MQYPFLSDAWIEAAKEIRADYEDRVPAPEAGMRINLVVNEVPFDGSDRIDAHLDTGEGRIAIDLGHIEEPDVTVTLDHATAKELFIGQDPEAVMTAFMGGRILIEGDLTALMGLMAQPPDDESMALALEIAERTKAMTAD